MDRNRFEKWMTSYLENDLSEVDKKQFEAFIAQNENERAYYEFTLRLKKEFGNIVIEKPTEALKDGFESKFQAAIDKLSKSKPQKPSLFESYQSILLDFFAPRKLAYTTIVLFCGFFLGNWFSAKDNNQVTLLEERIDKLESTVQLAQLNSQSPADRIQAITTLTISSKRNPQVIDLLSEKVKNDDNSHVQLAALSALKKHIQDPYAKKKMVSTLMDSDELFLKILLMQIIIEWNSELVKKEASTILSKDTLDTRYRTALNKLII